MRLINPLKWIGLQVTLPRLDVRLGAHPRQLAVQEARLIAAIGGGV